MKEDEIRKRELFNKYLELSAKDIKIFFKDKSRFYESKNCIACKSKNIDLSFRKNDFQYYYCKDCNTLFANPRPSIEMLDKFYTDSESSKYWIEKFFRPVAEVRREKIFKPHAEYISTFIKDETALVIGDIGAGFGLFLNELKKIRPIHKYIAIEPSIEMAQICRNNELDVIPNFLEKINEKEQIFDVLTAFELFEHLQNPHQFLKNVHRLLNSGGYFIFSTLNGLGFDIQILWERSKSISPPHHLNFFNPWSVKILAENVGFKVTEISTPGNLDWDIIESGFKKENIRPGRLWETISKYGNDTAKKSLQKWIREHNFSSHMRIILYKK